MAEEIHDDALDAGGSSTIEDLPADMSPTEILMKWRAADRERAAVEQGSVRWLELSARVEALRRAYQRSYDRSR